MSQRWYRFLMFALLTMFLSASSAFAGNGKINGTVKATDGSTIPSANVTLEETVLGGSADVDGKYFILNVPPGTYRVRASAVGHTPKVVTGVRVASDQILTVDFTLEPEAVGLAEVVVEAQRPPIDKSQTSARTTLTSDDFTSLPISDATALVATSASTFNGFIRGGKQYETRTLIDGIDVTDQFYASAADQTIGLGGGSTPYMTYNGVNRQREANGSALVNMNLASVEEANVLVGGVGSDYNSASAGIIAYSLREARTPLSWRLDARVSQTGGLKHRGPNLYWDQQNYLNERARLAKSAQQAERDKAARFTWYPSKYSYGQLPTYDVEGSFGLKPTEDLGVFFTAGYFDSHGRLPNEFTRRVNGSLKLNYNVTSEIRLAAIGLLEDRGKLFGWKNTSYMEDFRYFLEGVPKSDGANLTGSLKLTHVLSPTTFYEVQFSSVNDNSRLGYSDDNNDGYCGLTENGNFLVFGDTAQVNFYMANAVGSQMNKFFSPSPRNEPASELSVLSAGATNWKVARPGIYYENFKNNDITVKGDFTSQITANHQLRGGLQGVFHNYDMVRRASYIGGVYPAYRNYVEEIWNIKPKEYGGYVQDRMEYAGLIINLGFRLDGLDLAGADYLNYFAPFLDTKDASGGQIRVPVRGDNVKVKWFFSPRLGVSHPISDRAAMYFSFSQQQQSQPFSRLFTNYNDFGNPSLPTITRFNQDPIKSTNYELGLQYSFIQDYSLDINAYYKDIQNYGVIAFTVTPKAPWRSYNINTNFGYADARGVELSVRKDLTPVVDWLTVGGRVSYAYSYIKQAVNQGGKTSFSTTGGDSALYNGGLPWSDIQYFNTIEQNINGYNTTLSGGYDRPNRITFNLFLRFPYEFQLSGVGTFQSGFYYPLTLADPRSRAIGTGPWDKRVDLRLEKGFTFKGYARIAVYVDLINAFNWTSILAYQSVATGGQLAWERDGDPTGGSAVQRSVTQDGSLIYDVPREVYFGVNFQF